MYYYIAFIQIYYNAKLTNAALNLLEQVIAYSGMMTCSST